MSIVNSRSRNIRAQTYCSLVIRVFLAVIIWVGLTVVPGYAGAPTDSVKATIDEILRILQEEELQQPGKAEERRQQLEKVVEARFNYQEMSRRALGAAWKTLSDQEKQEFVDLFRTLLTSSYAHKIETYSGGGVQYLNERTKKNYAEVKTKVLSGKTKIPLNYRLINEAEKTLMTKLQ